MESLVIINGNIWNSEFVPILREIFVQYECAKKVTRASRPVTFYKLEKLLNIFRVINHTLGPLEGRSPLQVAPIIL